MSNNKKKKIDKKGDGFFAKIKRNCRIVTDFLANPKTQFVVGVVLVAFAVFLLSSFISFFSVGGADQSAVEEVLAGGNAVAANSSGRGGALLAHYLVNGCFGWAAVLLFPLVVLWAIGLMRICELKIRRWTIMILTAMVWFSLFFSFVFGEGVGSGFVSPGGKHGYLLLESIQEYCGVVGVALVLVLILLFFMIYATKETIPWLQKKFTVERGPLRRGGVPEEEYEDDEETDDDLEEEEYSDEEDGIDDEEDDCDEDEEDDDDSGDEATGDIVIEIPEEPAVSEDDELAVKFDDMSRKVASETVPAGDDGLSMEVEKAEGDVDMGGDMIRPINPKDELSYYKPPTLDLLEEYEQTAQAIDRDEQAKNANKIVEVLRNFGIEISSIKATVGPTITLYEVTPAPGVRIMKIRNLEDDIAMSLSALCIRIVAPIPGKGTVGIEVPNAHKQIVPMVSLLNSRKYKETDMELPLALGKTISNEVYMVDMAKMPHLLVAGATGMGKSVGLNAIITSLLYKMHPAYLKFVMVDPKMVELSLYGVLEKHFLAKLEGEDEPIITDVNRVVRTLKSLCVEMDNRYKLLQLASVRSVKEYNVKFLNKELLPTLGHRFMPYIVVIIDEYGDLMMTAGREVEQPIARIAQKARAVGIHMIIATQRPTTNIITGTIKANFPARMAFRVISAIDSRTILDRSGANQLQGRGDMLFLAGNDPVRVQCALVETKEVERVCAHIAKQQGYLQAYILPEPDDSGDVGSEGGGMRGDVSLDKLDPLFAEAARIVVLAQHGSTSLIQRKLEIGFNRAGRIMDQLCRTGIVGEQEGSKPRQVLCADEADLEFRLKSLL